MVNLWYSRINESFAGYDYCPFKAENSRIGFEWTVRHAESKQHSARVAAPLSHCGKSDWTSHSASHSTFERVAEWLSGCSEHFRQRAVLVSTHILLCAQESLTDNWIVSDRRRILSQCVPTMSPCQGNPQVGPGMSWADLSLLVGFLMCLTPSKNQSRSMMSELESLLFHGKNPKEIARSCQVHQNGFCRAVVLNPKGLSHEILSKMGYYWI